ncbi:glycosyltransferase family 39 protein [Teredinibacter purpureus]|uniref:glycosyltransferase family 39 protein n=1 Tax=Teredinibacter purpureus TaxID=2731756 RepID=UPI0006989B19|nr:glycosyltransferase family 39 protein [Teredinibacter purpureus]
MLITLLSQYFTQIHGQHKQLLATEYNHLDTLNTAKLYQLFAIAMALFCIALVGFGIKGYHFAFYPINGLASHLPEVVLHLLTVFGDGGLLLALVLLIANTKARFHWLVFVTAILGGIVSNVSKEYFDALRPPAVLGLETFNIFGKAYKYHSFPSGHTLTAFLLATAGFYHAEKPWQKIGLMIGAVLVGFSRIGLGVHWPADTLVGGGLGILTGIAAIFITHYWRAGRSVNVHGFIVSLFILACVLLLVDKNDYRLALPLLYIVAVWALCRTVINYLVPHTQLDRLPITYSHFKLPVVPIWCNAHYLFWFFLAAVTIYRIAVLFQPHFSLFYDEAYYYHWSLNPDLGYYSKPPMVAWVITVSTGIFGSSVVAIKLMASLLYGAAAITIYSTLKRYSTPSNALIGGLVFLCIPMIGFNSEFITTDAPLIFFWSVALLFALRAIEEQTFSMWFYLGVATGLGMLSKYTMGALPIAVFGYLLTSKIHRPLLLSYGPWLAAIVAGAIFSLNIYWNHINGWVALHHTQEISQTSGKLFNVKSLAEFTASQWIIFGPVCSYLLLKGIVRTQGTLNKATAADITQPRFHLLLWVMLTILGTIALQAFLSRAFPNWAGPWMVAATLLLALTWPAAFTVKRFHSLLMKALAINLVLLSLFYHWPALLRWIDIEPNRKNDPFQRVAGWPALAEELKPFLTQYPNAILTSDSRDLLAYLGYFAMPNQFQLARWNPDETNIRDYYDLKANLRKWQGKTDQGFIFVSRRELNTAISSQFERATPLGVIATEVYRNDSMSVSVSYLKGFKGYTRDH